MKNKPSTRAEIITRRTYCRPMYEKNIRYITDEESLKNPDLPHTIEEEVFTRFEQWEDVVDRVISHQRWLWTRAKYGKYLNIEQENELTELKNLMLERKASMSGRNLWLGGTEIARTRESSQFNCLQKDTLVYTKEYGLVPIANLVNKTASVLNDNGEYVTGFCRSGGIQELYQITFTNGRQKIEVQATPNHRWWLTNGNRVSSLDLTKGHIVPFVRANEIVEPSIEGIIHGLMYADGTIAKNTSGEYYRIRLCGDKRKYLSYFKDYPHSYPPSCKGDPFVYLGNVLEFPYSLKDLPETDNINYISGFIKGFLLGDGAKNKTGFSGNLTTLKYIEKWCHLQGHVMSSYYECPNTTNFGIRKEPLYKGIFKKKDSDYYFKDKVLLNKSEEVFCFEVPNDECFVINQGLLTSNCAFTKVETVYDVVDVFWLLLQGCGVGFKPVRGTLNGFFKPIKHIEVIRSTKQKGEKGRENTIERVSLRSKEWYIQLGDSAEAWAKFIGKLLAGKYKVDKIILDFSEIRCQGERLKGYGWISSGDEAIAKASVKICKILSKKAGTLLTAIDILDIINHLGTVLSSRRSAQICLMDVQDYEAEIFSTAKKDFWTCQICGCEDTPQGICNNCGNEDTNHHRSQSNNSLVFWKKPSKETLENIFGLMVKAGGSEPGFINGEIATKRAPWFAGVNPCAEILLGNKSFCNLVEIDVAKFKGDNEGLKRCIYIMARANYRQTLVNLKDGILQEAWHLNNEFLRLCGVGLTGLVQREDLTSYELNELERIATSSAYSMADEFELQRPKNITTVKPSGTLSKIMDTTEGLHKPLGKYIFNNVIFSKSDENLPSLMKANYNIFDHPFDTTSVIVTFPVKWDNVKFDNKNGIEGNFESAITQLERYKLLQNNYTQQNTSVTISYDITEIPAIIEWLLENWESYVGVSFLYRTDPRMTAKDLGYLYLPQQVVTKETYENYLSILKNVEIVDSFEEIGNDECQNGICPVK